MNETKMVGIRIKTRRKELNLTQKDIYAATGISNGNLSEIERGNVLPSSKALILLSQLLQTSIDWILTGEYPKLDISKDVVSKNRFQLSLTESEELIIFMLRSLPPKEQMNVKNYIREKVADSEKSGLSLTLENGKESTEENSITA